MHIARAYCLDAGKIVDIYQARGLFFGQDEPRRRFEFLCSDDACRATNATKVTGVNYDKLVKEGDRIAVRPHFRMNPESPHIDACEWVVRERALEPLDSVSAHTDRTGQHHRFRRLKSSDLVAVFWPQPMAAPALPDRDGDAGVGPSVDRERETLSNTRAPQLAYSLNRTRADFLETITSAYELLEPKERRETNLRIGRGPALSYHKAFCRIENYFAVPSARIFHGGVRVQRHGPNFAVRFFDRVHPDQAESNVARTVVLYLKRNVVQEHWNGRFLVAPLTQAAKPGHYAHCYFFGRLVSHPTRSDRLVVEAQKPGPSRLHPPRQSESRGMRLSVIVAGGCFGSQSLCGRLVCKSVCQKKPGDDTERMRLTLEKPRRGARELNCRPRIVPPHGPDPRRHRILGGQVVALMRITLRR